MVYGVDLSNVTSYDRVIGFVTKSKIEVTSCESRANLVELCSQCCIRKKKSIAPFSGGSLCRELCLVVVCWWTTESSRDRLFVREQFVLKVLAHMYVWCILCGSQ